MTLTMARSFLGCLLLVSMFCADAAADEDGVSIVLRASEGETRYTINGEAVADTDLLRRLGKVYGRLGQTAPVAVIASTAVRIGTVANTRGILGKVGFSNVRYFYFSGDERRMGEISFDLPTIPFSLQPWTLPGSAAPNRSR